MVLIHKKYRLKPIIFTLFLLIMLFFGLKKIDERLFPSAEAIGTAYAADYINKQIDLTAKKIAEKKGVSYTDFFTLSETNGEVSQIVANSLLINEFCSEIAAELSDTLFKTEVKKFLFPLGF